MAPIGPKRGTNEDRRVGAAFASQPPNPRHHLEPLQLAEEFAEDEQVG